MDIYYTNETLYVTISEKIDDQMVSKIQRRVFHILDDYEIENVELRISDCELGTFNSFINAYKCKYNGNLKIK